MTTRIEIVGQVGDTPCDSAVIMRLLDEANQVVNRHGESFTGRPTTHLLVSESHVIKQRTEYKLKEKDARRFIDQAIERERRLGLYPPAKSWFLIFDEGAETPLIANITPRLRPLNDLSDDEHYLDYIRQMFEIYLSTAARQELSLDIALSNFAIDSTGHLYYIDDDVYGWDRFTTLSHYLGVLIRTEERFDEEQARTLGQHLHHYVLEHFGDRLWCSVIAEETHGLFMPEPRKGAMRALLRALTEGSAPARQKTVLPTSSVVALLGDIHANAPALERVFNYLEQRGISEMLVMGDVVGYGPHPAECIDMLRAQRGARVLQGNHDHAVVSQNYGLGFSPVSKWVIEWSKERLTADALAWLDSLPLYLQGDDWIAVHGAPNDKTFFNAYVYEMSYEDNLANLESRNLHLCFHGHTHLQKVYYRKHRQDRSSTAQHQQIKDFDRALICPGSVGQPRNGKPGTELALLDRQSGELEFIHLEYDMSTILSDMSSYSFPLNLIDRLKNGR